MSASLLNKSLKLFEDNSKKSVKGNFRNIKKHGKKKKEVIYKHLREEELKKKTLEENLRNLRALSHFSVSAEVSKEIFSHVVKGNKSVDLEPKKEDRTVFTEEDFEAFEKEYFIEN